jgi:two-component system sensor histidine kinase KdpD
MAKDRKRPEDFLELVERAKRGRLKVYIGSAAGVGKTYQMLEEAHALKKRGVDVVLAFIEPHDRLDTEALIEGLEVVPRQRVEYRGVVVEEMDIDAVLKRNPHVAVVDELAHTNAPFCRNKKRYQDVVELLDAGINVICAFNVQHLESLNDLVKQATGVVVRETVPDSIRSVRIRSSISTWRSKISSIALKRARSMHMTRSHGRWKTSSNLKNSRSCVKSPCGRSRKA